SIHSIAAQQNRCKLGRLSRFSSPISRLPRCCGFRLHVEAFPSISISQIQNGETKMRRASAVLLTIVAMVMLLSVVSAAQSIMTRHVREATVTGEARPVGRLPAAQQMRFDVVLPLRHGPELDNFLQELYEPSSPSYRHFLTSKEFMQRFGPS